MGFRNLEAAILAELKQVANNSKIRQKDIVEWSTGMVKAQEGETYFHLPNLGVHVCVILPAKKSRPTKHAPDVVESAASSELVQASAESTSQGESKPATTQVM